MEGDQDMKPIARQEDLSIRRNTGELYIHDLKHEAYICLNPTTAYVWEKCDGRHDKQDIAQAMESELGVKVSEGLINSTLDLLVAERLIETASFA
jgi:Coenzyme PQQ synthesis protein D (PqqD)